ncbi:hypothetical protein RRG08_041011 [Elysia crispata]|uniref:Uncharacterized protein n=1 Tax=Elysia crispata TaxID=231223 RepID=A0AAE1BDN8_9GAST|nr:hypothetical protein RRG08_041011 [Elysia crispata]
MPRQRAALFKPPKAVGCTQQVVKVEKNEMLFPNIREKIPRIDAILIYLRRDKEIIVAGARMGRDVSRYP